jgi:hypothetical protein
MRDQELRDGLDRLARQFERVAVPERGRHVRRPHSARAS